MVTIIKMEIEMPRGMESFRLPNSVNCRLQQLLDKQDGGKSLTSAERTEADELVELSEWLSLLQLRSRRLIDEAANGL